jgi:hypothetical protein
MISFGLYISGPPPVRDDISFQAQDHFPGISLTWAGLGTKTTMETVPEFFWVFQNTVLGPNLDIADHLSGKVFIDERAYGSTGATVETIKGRINTKFVQLFCKSGINNSHSFSSS